MGLRLVVAPTVQVADVEGDGRLYGPGETIAADADTDTCARFAAAIRAGYVEVHASTKARR